MWSYQESVRVCIIYTYTTYEVPIVTLVHDDILLFKEWRLNQHFTVTPLYKKFGWLKIWSMFTDSNWTGKWFIS